MNTDQAFVDGTDAFRAGQQPKDCPISPFKAALHDAWMAGWLKARDDRNKVNEATILRRQRLSY